MTPTTIVLAWEIALTVVVLMFLAAGWTLWVYRLNRSQERDAFQDMRVVADTAADLNKRSGQIIEQLGKLAAEKPIVEVQTGRPIVLDGIRQTKMDVGGNGRMDRDNMVSTITDAENL